MIHLDHQPSVSTPTTQPRVIQNNDPFSWNTISTSSRDSEPRALNKDNSPPVLSASIAPPFPPEKATQNTSPIRRRSSLTPPSSPRRDGEAEVAPTSTAPKPITAPAAHPISQDASADPPPNPQQDFVVDNPPPSRPLTPLSELSPVPDNDEDAPLDAQVADKGEGSSSLQTTASSPSRQIPANLEASSSHIRISPSRPHPSSDHSPQRGSLSGPSGTASSAKAELILRLNAELIKICMEFQSRGIPTDDQRYQHYASRLQSNLTWLAAAADSQHTQNRHPPLIMQPPPPIDFISTETVRQLYAAMPTIFARDIARAKGQLLPPQSMPTLKRERPADGPELAIKRRDTGESKAGTGMPPPATPALAPKSVPISAQPFPGGTPQGAMDRTRIAQMRQQQAQFQAQAPPAQQAHVSAGGRQMSPPQGTNAGVGVGVGQPQGQSQAAAIQQQAVNSLGPQGMAFVQQLQDPNSAFVKYMVEQIPNFMTLPLPQQLESMQQAQRMIQQQRRLVAQQQMQQQHQFQQQQQQLQQQQQPQPPQPPQPPQQTQQQQQQQQHNQQQPQRPNMGTGHTPSQLQMTAQSQNSLVAGGIDPRTGGPSMTPAQIQQQLSGLQPHQRQLLFMQQARQQQQQHQQHQQQQQQQQQQPSARSSGINNNLGPGGLITQQFGGGGAVPANLPTTAALLHQRQQQQARLQQQAQQQSQLGEAAAFTAGPVGNNGGIPGIARSTRSPSDSTHSPLTPRGPHQQLQQLQQQSQSQSQQQPPQGMDYQRALMIDAARVQVGSPAPGPGFVNTQPLGTFGAGIGRSGSTGALANGSYSVSPPGSAHSRTSFSGTAAAPSPSATTSGNWQTGGTAMNANGGWQGAPGAAAGMGGMGGTMGLDHGTFSYAGDSQAFGTDGLVMDSNPMDPPGIEFNDIFNIPG